MSDPRIVGLLEDAAAKMGDTFGQKVGFAARLLNDGLVRNLAALLVEAVAWEREACAQICDNLTLHPDEISRHCAVSIRARSKQ